MTPKPPTFDTGRSPHVVWPWKRLRRKLWLAWWDVRGCWYAVLNLPWSDQRVQAHHRERWGEK